MNDTVPKSALLAPSGDETLQQASQAASEVTQQMLAQKLELEDKKRSLAMMQKALVLLIACFYTVFQKPGMRSPYFCGTKKPGL